MNLMIQLLLPTMVRLMLVRHAESVQNAFMHTVSSRLHHVHAYGEQFQEHPGFPTFCIILVLKPWYV